MNTILETTTHKIESAGTIYKPTKSDTERQWRDSELLRTDELVKLPDYPIDLLPYRAELRNYPAQPDFPNGTRPEIEE
jgi:hypothetical protein